MGQQKIIVICGPTASGKSTIAFAQAKVFNAEIVSADSMQIYKYMDVGTAKPTKDDRAKVAHHMIDVVEPNEPYSAAKYKDDASRAIDEVIGRGKNVIVCGGSGLYIRVLTKGIFTGPERDKAFREALEIEAKEKGTNELHKRLKEVDPVSAKNIHPNNLVRIIRALEVFHASGRPFSEFHAEHAFSESPYDALMLYIERPRAELYTRIDARAVQMIEEGLVEETKALIAKGYKENLKPMRALGYKEMVEYISGRLSLDDATELLKKNTRNYAKRQITWFKNVDEIIRVSAENIEAINEHIRGHLL
jgi:tRNA dimethylallyltransferase